MVQAVTDYFIQDRITTRSPGNGGAWIDFGGTNAEGNRADRDPGVTPVQRQGYPSREDAFPRRGLLQCYDN